VPAARRRVSSILAFRQILIWAMVYPMMIGVDFSAMRRVGDKAEGLIITLVVNWLIKPFTMAALGVLFFEVRLRALIPGGCAAISPG
jgi:ACR3 family arsenite transporter